MSHPKLKLLVLAVLLASVTAQAQQVKKKLYRWVDKEGKVHYDDALPPEAVDQARQEFSAKTGSVTGSVDRALTPEERAQQEAAAKAAAAANVTAEEQSRNEQAMLTSYDTEADLRRAYNERLELLKQTLESTDVGLQSLHASLSGMLSEAAEAELEHRVVDTKRANQIREMHIDVLKQQVFQANRKSELMSLDTEFQRMLTRYRELHAAAAGVPASATSTAPAAPPTQP
jgi:SHS2 domain-containing protein